MSAPRCVECGNYPNQTEIEMIDDKDGTKTPELWCPAKGDIREHQFKQEKTEATYYEIWRHDPNGDTKLGTFDTEKACRDSVEWKALPRGSYHYIRERVVDLSGPTRPEAKFPSLQTLREEAETRKEPERSEILRIAERIEEIFNG